MHGSFWQERHRNGRGLTAARAPCGRVASQLQAQRTSTTDRYDKDWPPLGLPRSRVQCQLRMRQGRLHVHGASTPPANPWVVSRGTEQSTPGGGRRRVRPANGVGQGRVASATGRLDSRAGRVGSGARAPQRGVGAQGKRSRDMLQRRGKSLQASGPGTTDTCSEYDVSQRRPAEASETLVCESGLAPKPLG